jgi:hypothetical protein
MNAVVADWTTLLERSEAASTRGYHAKMIGDSIADMIFAFEEAKKTGTSFEAPEWMGMNPNYKGLALWEWKTLLRWCRTVEDGLKKGWWGFERIK